MLIENLHCFSVRDRVFAFDVSTTSCAEIDDVAMSALPELVRGSNKEAVMSRFAEIYPRRQLRSAVNQCEILLDSGVFGASPPSYRHPGDRSLVGASLHVSHICNLDCAYCYADAGSFGRKRQLMSQETIEKSIRFLFEHSGRHQPSLDIGFFGGEPLLNFLGIQAAVQLSHELAAKNNKQISFSLTSNGTLLTDEIMAFLVGEPFSLIFSLDGPAAVHNKMRRDQRGRKTHEKIVSNLIRLRDDYNADFMVRGTFTRSSPNFSDQVLYLNDMGFTAISVEPAQLHPDDPLSISSQSDIERVKREYDLLADLYLERLREGRPLSFFHFEQPMRDILLPRPSHTQCGAGRGFVAITPEGDIFPCFEAVVEPGNQIGNIESGFERQNRERFARVHVDRRSGCSNCWIRYHCGGGCHAFNIRYNGSLSKPYEPFCIFIKHRYMLAAWILAEITEDGAESLEKLKAHLGLAET